MKRAILIGLVVALGACGGEDRPATGASPELPSVEAPTTSPATPQGMAEMAGEAVEAVTPPEVANCLQLVAESRFQDAIAVCTQALDAAPDNAEVEAALDKARQQAGEAAAQAAVSEAQQAAEGAAAEAGGEAASELEETKEAIPGLPQ